MPLILLVVFQRFEVDFSEFGLGELWDEADFARNFIFGEIFFVNFVKDEKYGILYLLLKSGKNNNFRNVIFDDKYKEFNVTWMRDKNNLFISFLCFS